MLGGGGGKKTRWLVRVTCKEHTSQTLDPAHSNLHTCWEENGGQERRWGGDVVTISHCSYVQVEGLHEEVQVTDVGGLEKFGLVHHGQRYPQSGPDAPRHDLMGQLLTLALPLQTQGS